MFFPSFPLFCCSAVHFRVVFPAQLSSWYFCQTPCAKSRARPLPSDCDTLCSICFLERAQPLRLTNATTARRARESSILVSRDATPTWHFARASSTFATAKRMPHSYKFQVVCPKKKKVGSSTGMKSRHPMLPPPVLTHEHQVTRTSRRVMLLLLLF